MIDTHAHIFLDEFHQDIDAVILRAREAGIKKILLPNINVNSMDAMKKLTKDYSDLCVPMMGLHPCYVKEDYKQALQKVEQELFEGNSYTAVGEIGTDLYWDKTFWQVQKEAFNIQCQWALELNLPVAIHCRESVEETIQLVKPLAEKGLKGVFHCFSGSVEQGKQIIELGFYLGIGGVSTFKNGGLDKVIPSLGTKKLVMETDSPYLTPVPYRGKRNEPCYLTKVVEKLAFFLQKSKEEVIETTTRNAKYLFRL